MFDSSSGGEGRSASERDAVLLIHGLGSTPMEWVSFSRALRAAGYTVCSPEIAGYSYDLQVPNASGYREWLDQLALQVAKLRESHDRVSVAGLCIGADLALALAARPDVKVDSLLLLSTTLFYDGWNISRWRWLLPLALHTPLGRWYQYRETPPYGVKNPRIRAWVERELQETSCSRAGAALIPRGALREAGRLIRHVKGVLSAITVPALIVHAKEDDVASTRNADFVASRIGSETVRNVTLHDSYHMVTIDNERDLVSRHALLFLGQHAQGAFA